LATFQTELLCPAEQWVGLAPTSHSLTLQKHLETSLCSGSDFILKKHIPLPEQILHPPAITTGSPQSQRESVIKGLRSSHTAISVVYWLEPSRDFMDTQLGEMKSQLRYDSLQRHQGMSEWVGRALASSLDRGAWREQPLSQAPLLISHPKQSSVHIARQ
jgi:hypothetical protein